MLLLPKCNVTSLKTAFYTFLLQSFIKTKLMRHTTARCHCIHQQTGSSWIKSPKASQSFIYEFPQSCFIWIDIFAFRVACHVFIIVPLVFKSGSGDQIGPNVGCDCKHITKNI